MTKCARCGKEGAEPVGAWLRWLASLSLAFAHGGMWAQEELKKPYCARCRVRVVAFSLALTGVALLLASGGLLIWLRGPR